MSAPDGPLDAPLSLTLFSPAGVVRTAAPLRLAARRLTGLGFAVAVDEAAALRVQRFAGDDDTRLAAIHRIAAAAPTSHWDPRRLRLDATARPLDGA